MSKKIFIAADHAGFEVKETLRVFLADEGYEVEDCGSFSLDAADDYPDFVRVCAEKVAATSGSFGIVIGASGQGEAMAANRVPGVRAAVYYGAASKKQKDGSGNTLDIIESERAHNDANILSLGARFLTIEEMGEAVTRFLTLSFSGEERHMRRIKKLG